MKTGSERAAPVTLIRDPLARVFVAGCIAFGVLSHTSLRYVGAAAAVYAWWTVAAGVSPLSLLRRLRGAFLFLFLIIAANAVTESGRVLFSAGGLYVTAEGLVKGGEQSLRLCLVIWGAFLLVSTGRSEEFQDAAERWTTRKGRPLLAAGMIAINYLPLLVESARRVTIARRARGGDDHPGFSRALTQVSGAALPIVASALRSADALAEAMESRCFDPVLPRTAFLKWESTPRDWGAAPAAALLTAAAVAGFI